MLGTAKIGQTKYFTVKCYDDDSDFPYSICGIDLSHGSSVYGFRSIEQIPLKYSALENKMYGTASFPPDKSTIVVPELLFNPQNLLPLPAHHGDNDHISFTTLFTLYRCAIVIFALNDQIVGPITLCNNRITFR